MTSDILSATLAQLAARRGQWPAICRATGLDYDWMTKLAQGRIGASAGLGVGDEAGGMLLHQAVQRRLLGAVAFVVDRGAIGSPLGLLRRGSHDGLPVG